MDSVVILLECFRGDVARVDALPYMRMCVLFGGQWEHLLSRNHQEIIAGEFWESRARSAFKINGKNRGGQGDNPVATETKSIRASLDDVRGGGHY